MHKNEEYEIACANIPKLDKDSCRSFSDGYKVIKSNKESMKRKAVQTNIKSFDSDTFSDDMKQWIPNLPEEFILPENLQNVCSAVTTGDLRPVLFH